MIEADNRDYLTGLYNRKGFTERYNSLSDDSKVHIMFCDLDNFKAVNDIYGHAAGDKLLIAVGELLQECAPEAFACRQGGDEFILFFEGDKNRKQLEDIAARIIEEVRLNRRGMETFSLISVSIGVVWGQTADEELGEILHKSDAAMYQAKHRGKDCYVFYDDLVDKIRRENEMERTAEEALAKGRFRLYFMPVINMQNSFLEQTRVYVRWEKEDGTFWEEEEYRPLLERNTFIRKVDEYIFEEVCKCIPDLRVDKQNPIKVSIQLSRLLFMDDKRLGERLQELMKQYGVEMSEVELAISESSFEHRNSERIVRSLKNLKAMGFSLGLIQFGVDFSSFRYLREMPINTLCFDPTYLKENMKNSCGKQIVKMVIRFGKDLRFLVVADGVVDQDEVMFLNGCGCDAACGNHYSKYLMPDDYVEYIKQRLVRRTPRIAYHFADNLEDEEGRFEGTICGENIEFVPGINDKWGGIHFPGGAAQENVIELPEQLFSGDSYTISLWIRPETVWSWGSVVYAAFLNGFVSVVPFAGEGISIFRVYEQDELNGWHDILCHSMDLNKWTMITVTYDSYSESTRYFINGNKAGYQVNVPTMYSCMGVVLGGDPFQKSYTGDVSGLIIFDRVKTEEEILELYRSFLEEPGFRG